MHQSGGRLAILWRQRGGVPIHARITIGSPAAELIRRGDAKELSDRESRCQFKLDTRAQRSGCGVHRCCFKNRRVGAKRKRNRDLIAIGAYQKGADPRTDAAVALWPAIEAFLRQDVEAGAGFEESLAQLDALLSGTPGP